ncbi:MAG TPA: hypothetical protein VM940_11275 [Chthoniobacterales bacterium]|jgi:YD repeat-containing protein|nr:hypothetical protein [Chthoniobacterales bacterium]
MLARFCAVTLVTLAATPLLKAQLVSPTPDAIRVTVSMNADGSKTVYEFDSIKHRATATTTARDGKLVGKIRYVLDDAGRFASGEVYGPDDQFRFRTAYKYDEAGRLSEETQFGNGDVVRSKIVYAYDRIGRQIGYSVYDAAGKLTRQTPGLAPRPTPSSKRR